MIAVMDRDQITAEVAVRLVAGQFPQWTGLPVVPVGLNGWDNITLCHRRQGRAAARAAQLVPRRLAEHLG